MNEKVIKFAEKYIKDVNKHFDISPKVDVSFEDDRYYVDIDGDNLNFLIGFRGDSLDGFQHFLGLALYREFGEWNNLEVDINGYRQVKREKIEDLAKSFIDRVRFFAKEVDMPSMPPYERKIVHEFISSYDDIDSYSVGERFTRHVVLKPKS